jgi:hypothetical protein
MKVWQWVLLIGAALFLWFGRSAPMPHDALEYFNARAPSPGAHQSVRAGCYQGRCLTIYLAPWCPVCRQSHDSVLALVEAMRARGVPTSVVLGMDTAETLRRFFLRLRLSTLFHCGGCFRRISWAAGSGADAPAVSPYELL